MTTTNTARVVYLFISPDGGRKFAKINAQQLTDFRGRNPSCLAYARQSDGTFVDIAYGEPIAVSDCPF
jgi:hypothetical protein